MPLYTRIEMTDAQIRAVGPDYYTLHNAVCDGVLTAWHVGRMCDSQLFSWFETTSGRRDMLLCPDFSKHGLTALVRGHALRFSELQSSQ